MTPALKITPDDLNKVFGYIESHSENFIARLIDYLRLPSISSTGFGIETTVKFLEQWLGNTGFETKVIATPRFPVVIGRFIISEKKPTVILYGHYDVQPAEPLDQWITPPFEPAIRNGRLYGRGAGDNKGQHAANLFAVESLLACEGKLPCNVIMLLDGEEEIGSPDLLSFVDNYRDLLKADLVITCDGPIDASGRPRLEFGARGILSFRLRARGANRILHSGNWGGVAPNPAWTLIHLLSTMKNQKGEITIDGFYDKVEKPTEKELSCLSQMPVDIAAIRNDLGIGRCDLSPSREFWRRSILWPAFTVNSFTSGVNNASQNIIPDEAVVQCDIRLVKNQTVEEIWEKLQRHVRKHAAHVELVKLGGMDPFKTPLDSPLAGPIKDAIYKAQGVLPIIVPSMPASLPNYVFSKVLGIPSFIVPYANADEANHTPNENIEISRFMAGIRTGASLLIHIGDPNSAVFFLH